MPTAHASLLAADSFVLRHIGPRPSDVDEMVRMLGYKSLDEFIAAVVPDDIRLKQPLALPPGRGEGEVLQALRGMAGQNKVFRSFIGMGYYPCFTPQVIQRNVLENPAGTRLHAISGRDRAGPPGSAAQLPDNGRRPDRSADRQCLAARRSHRGRRSDAMSPMRSTKHVGKAVFFVSARLSPADDRCGAHARRGARDQVRGRRTPPHSSSSRGCLRRAACSIRRRDGDVVDYRAICDAAHAAGALVTVAADLLA